MREANNKSWSIFLSVVGVYVVRTSSLNDKHSCQLFRKASSLVLLSSSVSTANLSCLLATTFSSLLFATIATPTTSLDIRINNSRRNAVPWTTSRGKCRCFFPPLQIVNSVSFCLFYLCPLSAPFLNSLSSPYPPSLLSLLINSLSS